MSKIVSALAIGLLASGFAFAQSSTLKQPRVAVKKASKADIVAIAKGEAVQGLWCDSLGFQWDLSGAGFSGGAIAVTGSATNMCGGSPASGTLTIAAGLPLDVTAAVTPGCFCNEFHNMAVRWNRATGLFEGTATAFGSCEGSGAVTLGRC